MYCYQNKIQINCSNQKNQCAEYFLGTHTGYLIFNCIINLDYFYLSKYVYIIVILVGYIYKEMMLKNLRDTNHLILILNLDFELTCLLAII